LFLWLLFGLFLTLFLKEANEAPKDALFRLGLHNLMPKSLMKTSISFNDENEFMQCDWSNNQSWLL
jgi:hypothetical protein